ncbi:MAG TPA: PVC-type heme-binding CxxCH protein, partial [Planctomycetota bacterium]|nr:PVC-type heme-binding CxxCH protein [Planctomycetota bacterium]
MPISFDSIRLRAAGHSGRLAGVWLALVVAVPAQRDPEHPSAVEVAAAMKLPPGITARSVLDERQITQPVCLQVDGKGRLWVVEYRTFAKQMDYSQTDSVVVFDDAKGDGSWNRRRVFYEGKNITSVAVGLGGVFICSMPDLLFVPDQDGDGVADGPATTLLDGWDLDKGGWTNNIFSNLTWGPDGWLYGCCGMSGRGLVGKPGDPRQLRIKFSSSVWRYHPGRHQIDLVYRGGTNPFGIDFTAEGELLTSDVGPYPIWHGRRGGNYQVEFEPACISPFAYQSLTSPYKRDGRQVSSGALVYQGDAWPAEWRGRFLSCNILGRKVTWNDLAHGPDGIVPAPDQDLLPRPADQWFFPVTLAATPGGGVLLADWSDPNVECHSMPVPDRSGGRIFLLAPPGFTAAKVDLPAATEPELIQAVSASDEWLSRRARLELQQRAAGHHLSAAGLASLRAMLGKDVPAARLRALWTLAACDAITDHELEAFLTPEPSTLRTWALRLLADRGTLDPAKAGALAAGATPAFRADLASAANGLSPAARRVLLESLVRAIPADDPQEPVLMTWYALEPLVAADPAWGQGLVATTAAPRLREFIARRIADAGGV